MAISFFIQFTPSCQLFAQTFSGISDDQDKFVGVRAYAADGKLLREGIGFFTGGSLITNRSVLLGASRATAVLSDRTSYPIERVVADDPFRDIVQLALNIPQIRIREIEISSWPVAPGSAAVIVTGRADQYQITIAKVEGQLPSDDFGTILRIRCNVEGKFEGGAVLDSRGRLLGLALPKLVPEKGLLFAIETRHLNELIISRNNMSLAKWLRHISDSKSAVVDVGSEFMANDEGLLFAGLNYIWLQDYAAALPHLRDPRQ